MNGGAQESFMFQWSRFINGFVQHSLRAVIIFLWDSGARDFVTRAAKPRGSRA